MIPVCPRHNKEMKQNSRGWYCPSVVGQNPDGSKRWCDYKPAEQAPAQEARTQAPPPWTGSVAGDAPQAALAAAARVVTNNGGGVAETLQIAETFLGWLTEKRAR